ncbi:MAG TPA: transposase [Gemmataceae bacterium]|jgi:hypothetical protein|nr:transposase [Gemmataceae bacterium]
MDQLIPSLHLLLAPLAGAFRPEVHRLFCHIVAAWIVCLGRRTISRVWETTGHAEHRNHAAAYRLFSQAVWNWDEVCRLLLLRLLALAPGVRLWAVPDDTLAHKRGAKVAFGGIFLDAVLSTRRHKVLRFGNNWVLLGIVVELAVRPNRYFCLPILWRVYQKQGGKPKKEHRTKSQLAAEMLAVLADWLPGRKILAVADGAYLGKHLLKRRPANVDGLGPIHWKAALYEALTEAHGRRKYGGRWPTPKEMMADDRQWPPASRRSPSRAGWNGSWKSRRSRGRAGTPPPAPGRCKWCWCMTRWANGGMRPWSARTSPCQRPQSSPATAGGGVSRSPSAMPSSYWAFTTRRSGVR